MPCSGGRNWLTNDGVLHYRRQKTKQLATVPLPGRLDAMLREVPLERDSVEVVMPFRTRNIEVRSDSAK